MTDRNLMIEHAEKASANQSIQQGMRVNPAILANGQPGVAIKVGSLTVCIGTKAAMNHALKVAEAIEYHKGDKA